MQKGWYNVSHLQTDGDLASLHELSEWAKIVKMAQANKDEFEKDLNKPLMRY